MKRWISIENRISTVFMILLLCGWEVIIRSMAVPAYILPAPSEIIRTLIEERSILWEHTLTTLSEAAVGFLAAILLAVILAGFMNKYRSFKKMIYPILVTSQTVPIIALAPLSMIWLGFGILPKIVIVILVCFFPVVVNVSEGLAAVDKDLVDLLKVMKASSWQVFTKVQLPATLPAFFSGLKIAATYSIMGAVIAEWIGAENGLGIYMTRAMSSFRTEALFADIFIIVFLSIALFQGIGWLGKRLMPWNK